MTKELRFLVLTTAACGLLTGVVTLSRVTAPQSSPAPKESRLSELVTEFDKKNASAPARKITAEEKSIQRLAEQVQCLSTPMACKKMTTAEDMRDALEGLEAQVRIHGLKDEKNASMVLLTLVESSSVYAIQAIQLLQEFDSAVPLMSLFDVSGLQPEVKIGLIEASLDPADESLKSALRSKARELIDFMFLNGSQADAFQAASALKLFPEMKDADFEMIGHSICRFQDQAFGNDVDSLKFEALKLRLQRSVSNRKQLKTLISTCKG